MEISSLFPSSDNLYKFLFMGGIFMVAFSFIYPLEKKQKIELEINLYNKQIELLNEDILTLNKDVEKLKIQTSDALKKLELQKSEKDEVKAKAAIKEIKDNYNKAFADTKSKENEIITKNIIYKYEKSKIGLLENHVGSFSVFRWILLICGTVFTLFGIFKWYKITNRLEKFQEEEHTRNLQRP